MAQRDVPSDAAEISRCRPPRPLLLVLRAMKIVALLHEGVTMSTPQKVAPKPRLCRTSLEMGLRPGSADDRDSAITLLLGILGSIVPRACTGWFQAFGEASGT